MDGLRWIRTRFAPGEPLSDPEVGVRLAWDRLAPPAAARAVLKEATEPSSRRALATELAEQLTLDHPSLRRVLAHGGSGEAQAVALEFVDGVELGAYLSARPEAAACCVEGLLRALVYLHGNGRAHGDLKPANVLVESGRVRLIDLGLVAPIGALRRGGTPGFLPPEHRESPAVSVAGDLYAFGALLRAVAAPLDGRLERLVAACLSEAPSGRPATADSALGMVGTVPRPVDRSGQVLRVGGERALAAVEGALERLDGTAVVVQAGRASGRTRLVRDGSRPALLRGQPLADSSLAGGHDPFGALAALLLPRGGLPDDPERGAAMAVAAAARQGIAIVLDDADQASASVRRVLPIAAATLSELGCGALVVVGADPDLAARLEARGALRHGLERLGPEAVAGVLTAAGAEGDRALVEALARAAEGRAGLCVRLALELADRPATSPAEVEGLAAEALAARPAGRTPGPPPAEAVALERAREGLARGAFAEVVALLTARFEGLALAPASRLEAASLLARAEAGRGDLARAAAIVERLGPAAPAGDRLAASRWLERLGAYERVEAMAAPLLDSSEPEHRASAAVAVSRAAFGLGEPERADRLATAGLDEPGLAPALESLLLGVRSDVALTRGEPEPALAHAAAAERAARAADDPTLLPQAISRAAAAHAQAGRPREARDRYLAALEAAREAGDVVGLPPYVLNLATAEHALGELGSAIERYQHAARLAGQLGRQVARAAALVNWAGLLVDVGASEEAGPVLEDARAAAEAAGSALYAAQVGLVRAAVAGRDSPETGRRLAAEARDAFRACGAARQALEADLLEAELALAGRDLAPALALSERRAGELAAGGLAARAALLEARARLEAGELDRALRAADRAATLAREGGEQDLEARALCAMALAHGRLGTGAEQPLAMRAREVAGQVAARLPAGLRDRYLQEPGRLAVARLADAGRLGTGEVELGLAPARLLGLVRRLLVESRSEDRLLEAAVDEAVAVVGAERAFLLRLRGGGRPFVAVARNIARETIRAGGPGARFSRSVADRVLETGEQVVTSSALDDPELRGARSVLDLGLRSILCVPIRAPEGVAGALYLDHRFETGRFGPRAADLVQSLADVIGVILEHGRLRRQAEDKARQLELANAALEKDNELRAAELERLGRLLEQGGASRGEAPGGMVGRSAALRKAIELGRRVAPSNLPVLVEGESGTGKELYARYLHDSSLRRSGPFLALNCGAVPETLLESELFGHARGAFTGASRDHPGLFRAASGGTVLLDEIGEMAPSMQPRLLRVLQEGEVWPLGLDRPVAVDVRVVAATNRDLEKDVEAGRFRKDLFFRLVGVRVVLPPLRHRVEDVPALVETFLDRIAAEPGMRRLRPGPEAMRELLRHPWPGNVRELEQTLRRAALLCEGEVIRPGDLGLSAERAGRKEAIRSFDRELVARALQASGGNRSSAARALGVSRSTLHRWLNRYGLR